MIIDCEPIAGEYAYLESHYGNCDPNVITFFEIIIGVGIVTTALGCVALFLYMKKPGFRAFINRLGAKKNV